MNICILVGCDLCDYWFIEFIVYHNQRRKSQTKLPVTNVKLTFY